MEDILKQARSRIEPLIKVRGSKMKLQLLILKVARECGYREANKLIDDYGLERWGIYKKKDA